MAKDRKAEKAKRRKARKAREARKSGGVVSRTKQSGDAERFQTLKFGPRVKEAMAMLHEGLMVPLWQVAHKGRSMCAIVHAAEREPAWEEAEKVLGVALGPVEGWTCVPMGVSRDLPEGWMWAAHPYGAPGYVPFAFKVVDRERLRETMLWADVKGRWGVGRASDDAEGDGVVEVDNDASVTVLRGAQAAEGV